MHTQASYHQLKKTPKKSELTQTVENKFTATLVVARAKHKRRRSMVTVWMGSLRPL